MTLLPAAEPKLQLKRIVGAIQGKNRLVIYFGPIGSPYVPKILESIAPRPTGYTHYAEMPDWELSPKERAEEEIMKLGEQLETAKAALQNFMTEGHHLHVSETAFAAIVSSPIIRITADHRQIRVDNGWSIFEKPETKDAA